MVNGKKGNRTKIKPEDRASELITHFEEYVKRFNDNGYRRGPDLYFYSRVISFQRKYNFDVVNLLNSKDGDKFVEYVYATLVAWDMNSRRAKMKYFNSFREGLLGGKTLTEHRRDLLKELSRLRLEKLEDDQIEEVVAKVTELYDNINIMASDSNFVSNSKVLHFLLPNLVMPMDRQNTIHFFYGEWSRSVSRSRFKEIFRNSARIAREKRRDINSVIKTKDDMPGDGTPSWHQTVPKVIDNAIIGALTSKED